MKLFQSLYLTLLLALLVSAASANAADEYEADIAFVLVGYGGETLFPTTESFKENASQVAEVFSDLSFGNISSYKIFDGGIDPRTVGPILAAAQITAIDEALTGWQSEEYVGFLDSSLGRILVDPTSEQIEVLLQARAWLVDNQASLFDGWFDTDVGRENASWVQYRVIQFASACDVAYLEGLRLPAGLDVTKFRTVTIIFSSQNQVSTTKLIGAMTTCESFGIADFNGNPIIGENTCSYSDYHKAGGEYSPVQLPNKVTVHEIIHGLGQSGHDESDDSSVEFSYSVMGAGFIDQLPIHNRIYQLNWLSPDTITEDPAELQDHKGATDPNGKYLLKLSAENNFDCLDEYGEPWPDKCFRYQENYGGALIQYKTTFLRDGVSYYDYGVRFEPPNDVTDTNPASVISAVSETIMTWEGVEEDTITITFDEPVSYGSGEIWLREESIQETTSYQTLYETAMSATTPYRTRYAPQYSCLENYSGLYCNKGITIAGNTVTLRSPIDKAISPGRLKYSVEISPGAILDRGGNSVNGKYCAYAEGEDTSEDSDGDGLVDCADAFPQDSSELFDTDIDGIGNNADSDDDNDGVLDVNEDQPLNPKNDSDEQWPSVFNGIVPDPSLGLAFNNVGVFDTSDPSIYACIRIFDNGTPSPNDGISWFDVKLEIVSLSEGTVKISNFRDFNVNGALADDGRTPDCSGRFEKTSGVYTDIIVSGDSILETTWTLTDPANLILTLDSAYQLAD